MRGQADPWEMTVLLKSLSDGFVEKLEEGLGRILKRRKPGPKRGHKHK